MIVCATPFISAPVALLIGLFIATFIGHPYQHLNHKATNWMLKTSIVGLGFGMNITTAWQAGSQGLGLVVGSISFTLLCGYVISRFFKVESKVAYLISAGTAICGGSAIAAVSPVIKAEEKQISIALGTVFILNSVALFIFPPIGHWLHLTQAQFGLWCAIAIHDTSSVVGAASRFGPDALRIATTVKLARALWIIPVTMVSAWLFSNRGVKISLPYFIGLFVVAVAFNTYVPFIHQLSGAVVAVSKAGLVLTLFLIGTGLSANTLRNTGVRPMLMGLILWVVVSAATLIIILNAGLK